MTAFSIFSTLDKDETYSPGRAGIPDKLPAGGSVLSYSDFEQGFDGWDQHYGGFLPNVPIGRTSRRSMFGNYGMLLSAGERPYQANVAPNKQIDNGTTAYKRMALYDDDWTTLSLSMFYTILGSEVLSYSAISMAFDIQAWDNSDRGHFRVELADAGTTDATLPRWKIHKNDASVVTIPSSTGAVTGENENKGGTNFARLTISRTPLTGSTHNGGAQDTIGSYSEFQSNNKVYDLSALGGGQGWQDPQDGDPIGDYRGGCNPGIGMYRSTRKPAAIPGLIVDAAWVTVEK